MLIYSLNKQLCNKGNELYFTMLNNLFYSIKYRHIKTIITTCVVTIIDHYMYIPLVLSYF